MWRTLRRLVTAAAVIGGLYFLVVAPAERMWSENLSILPLGTKKVTIRGNYNAKAGYRLNQGVSLRLEGGKPIARFPRPEIISVVLIDFEVIKKYSGWLNKIQPADRAQILRELRQQARRKAIHNGALQTVESTLQARLQALLGAESVAIEHTLS